MADAYLHFAKSNRNLYEVFMSFHTPDHVGSPRQRLWSFTVEQVERITGEKHAGEGRSRTLGLCCMEQRRWPAGQVYGQIKPASALRIRPERLASLGRNVVVSFAEEEVFALAGRRILVSRS